VWNNSRAAPHNGRVVSGSVWRPTNHCPGHSLLEGLRAEPPHRSGDTSLHLTVPQALETIATAGDASQLGAKSLAHASHHITEAFAMNPALRLITSESFLGLFSLFGLLCSLGVIALAVLS
jgi:hypothetical protein